MVVFRAELWCTGCHRSYNSGIVSDDTRVLASLGSKLKKLARADGWTIESKRGADWCPACAHDPKTPLQMFEHIASGGAR